jgi:hypothetical protein
MEKKNSPIPLQNHLTVRRYLLRSKLPKCMSQRMVKRSMPMITIPRFSVQKKRGIGIR